MDRFLPVIAINQWGKITIDINELSLIVCCCSHHHVIFKFKLAHLTYIQALSDNLGHPDMHFWLLVEKVNLLHDPVLAFRQKFEIKLPKQSGQQQSHFSIGKAYSQLAD